jgi:2-keto-3-deoxy-L-rhamnonate aldolase RhmA
VSEPAKGFRRRLLAHEFLVGSFLNLGSPLTAEIMACAGLDWVVIDLEHGHGNELIALMQVQAISATTAEAFIRIESNSRPRFHRALELGAVGVLVPRVDSPEDAAQAVASTRFSGVRGISRGNRAWGFGVKGDDYLGEADAEVVCAIQIETRSAYDALGAIARIEGVDMLFLGPADLANALRIRGRPDHPEVLDAARQIASVAAAAGKAAGVVVENLEQAEIYAELGFTFLGCSSDTALLAAETRRLSAGLCELGRSLK